MPDDKHWKTVKMGSSDELCGISCWGKKILGKVGSYILGSGYNPSINETLSNAIDEKLKSRNVILHTNEAGTRRVIVHKLSEGDTQIKWSLQEKS
jgi:hypothetical protein